MTEVKTLNLTDIPQAQLKDLLDFPCPFTFKVVGKNRNDLIDDVVRVTQQKVIIIRESILVVKEPIIPFLSILLRKILSR